MQAARARDDRGSMLIVALGILTLLSVLALTFVSLMRLEQTATNNYVDMVKSRLIAEGGLEQSMAQLKRNAGGASFSDPTADWVYAEGNYWLPLEEASAVRRGSPDDEPALNPIRASFAGSLGQSYAQGKDQYKVKVIDTQTQFNLNSEFDIVDGIDLEYVRFLDALGVAISKINPRARDAGAGTTPGAGRNPIYHARFPREGPNPVRGGEAIYKFRQSREGKRFNSKTELLEVLENEEDYKLVRDYVTTRSWLDPKTVGARALNIQGASGNPNTVRAWSDVTSDVEPRSPININLATTEVLAANLAGVAGRGIFFYAADLRDSPSDPRLQNVDAGTRYEYSSAKEEANFQTNPPARRPDASGTITHSLGILVYIDPFGFEPGQQPNDPPVIDPAIEVAYKIRCRIGRHEACRSGHQCVTEQGQGPFRTFGEWERFVDKELTDTWLASHYPANGPADLQNRIFHLNERALTADPSPGDVIAHPRFKPWYYNAIRSMLKANFNPNARLSSWNPDPAVYLPIDKGGLVFFADPDNPASSKPRHQTNEWCLASKGIFEIISLGEVLGPPPADARKGTDPLLYAQAKVRGVIQLFDTLTHRTQRDFERNGGKWKADRDAIATYPVPRIYWDPRALPGGPAQIDQYLDEGGSEASLHASELDGHVEISTLSEDGGAVNKTRWVEMGIPSFELLLQDRRLVNQAAGDPLHRDPLLADMSGFQRHNTNPGQPMTGSIGNGWGWPFPDPDPATPVPSSQEYSPARRGVSPITRATTEQESWRWDVLTPDGYLNTDLRKTLLWYRASDRNSQSLAARPDGRLRGDSMVRIGQSDGGNVAATPRGGVEFWYKPDFDWAVRQTTTVGGQPASTIVRRSGQELPDQRYCGLLAISHVCQNDTGFQGGQSPALGSWTRGTQMFVTRNTAGELRITRLFYEVVGPAGHTQEEPLVEDPKAPGTTIKFTEYFTRAGSDLAYTWPPKELYSVAQTPFQNIRWARTDQWVPFQRLKDWRAREWHHIAIYWDDEAQTENVQVWLDGLPENNLVRRSPPLGDRYEPYFPDPTQPPGTVAPIAYSDYQNQTGMVPPTGILRDGKLPSFVRLNALTGPSTPPAGQDQAQYEASLWPKDQVILGGVRRDQAAAGGLFKHEKDALLAANGTIDDVRFYDGTQAGPTTNRATERYERFGAYANEFEFDSLFPSNVDVLKLGGLYFTAYLPTYFAEERYPDGAGQVTVFAEVQDQSGQTKYTFPHWTATYNNLSTGQAAFLLTDDVGVPVEIARGDRLVYFVELQAATRTQGSFTGQSIMSPVLDEVATVYLLPNPRILLKERVLD